MPVGHNATATIAHKAQSNLGLMYGTGDGTQENDKEAVKWFRKAAEQGSAEDQFNLGSMIVLARESR